MSVKYHFFGKECVIDRGLRDYSKLESCLQENGFLPNQPIIFVNQIHSVEVVVIDNIDKIHPAQSKPKADAIVTNLENIIIAIFTADCLPILMFDRQQKIISITHAGWKGAKANIIANSLEEMRKLGAKLENIEAIIGPAIRQKSYQVSSEFYQNFLEESEENKKFFIKDSAPKHYLFDLPAYAKEKLKKAGIKNITDEEIDTYSNPEKYFSYRRSAHLSEEDCGRNVSLISLSK